MEGGGSNIHELRWNPFLGQWVIIAGHRGRRPWRPEERERGFRCPFCPGSPETERFGDSWDVIVLPNKFPALKPDAPEVAGGGDLFRRGRALGLCEVVVETPEHEGDLHTLGLEHMAKVVRVFADEYRRLGSLPYVKYVAEFRNKGKEIGVSLTHPHSQIYAMPFIPPRIEAELKNFKRFFEEHGECLLCAVLREELRDGERVVYSNRHFVVVLPFFAMWPYELHVYPRRHVQSLDRLSDDEVLHLADALRVVTATYSRLFDRDLPYIMAVHQAPTDGGDYGYYHLHVEFYQPYREQDKMKYAAGIEWGFGTFTYDGVPEEKAEELRAACRRAVEGLDAVLGSCGY